MKKLLLILAELFLPSICLRLPVHQPTQVIEQTIPEAACHERSLLLRDRLPAKNQPVAFFNP